MSKKTTAEEKFWKNIQKTPGCWIWTGATKTRGYGLMRSGIGDGKMLSHRFAWELFNGPIPKGDSPHSYCVCHKCDNPSCCNPDHLFLASHNDNMADMNRKGRHAAKLSPAQVLEIRDSHLTHRQVAEQYGVHRKTVEKIRQGKRWNKVY